MRKSNFLILNFFFVLFLLIPLLIFNQSFKKKDQPKPTTTPEPKENIVVYNPKPNSTVTSKFKLTGVARTFENTFTFRLKDKKTNQILGQSATVSSATESGEFGKFNFDLDFSGNANYLKTNDELILEVFQKSAKDGSEIDKVRIPLIFEKPIEATKSSN